MPATVTNDRIDRLGARSRAESAYRYPRDPHGHGSVDRHVAVRLTGNHSYVAPVEANAMDVFPDPIRRFVAAAGPAPTDLQREMARYGREAEFPFLGAEVGGLVAVFTRMVGASRVFEFGSGFGYSASWFMRGLPPGGDIVLTEIDEDDVRKGRRFLGRMDTDVRFTYEVGDALDVVERYDGPFDVVLIDHQKERYVEAFEAVTAKVEPGGLVIADNMLRGPFDFEDVLAGVEGSRAAFDAETRGIVDYVEHVREAPDFESGVIPVGSGISLSYRVR